MQVPRSEGHRACHHPRLRKPSASAWHAETASSGPWICAASRRPSPAPTDDAALLRSGRGCICSDTAESKSRPRISTRPPACLAASTDRIGHRQKKSADCVIKTPHSRKRSPSDSGLYLAITQRHRTATKPKTCIVATYCGSATSMLPYRSPWVALTAAHSPHRLPPSLVRTHINPWHWIQLHWPADARGRPAAHAQHTT